MTRYPGNIEHQYEVFRSPENYGERFGGRPDIHIPVTPTPMYYREVVDGGPLPPLTDNRLILTRHKCSVHITHQTLDQYCPNLNFRELNSREAINMHKAWVVAVMRKTAEDTYQKLKEETWDNEHNVLIDSVKIIWQYESDRILVNMRIYACRYREVELAQQRFQQALLQLLQNSVTLDGHVNNVRIEDRVLRPEDMERAFGQMQQIGSVNWEHMTFTGPIGKRYDDKAEKRATKLLKSMLSKKEYKTYEKEGYVKLKGKSGRIYKVKKNAMIGVTEEKYKGSSGVTKVFYRLCIEPKHHGTICPTDEVVAKIKLIQSNEEILHKVGHKFKDNSGLFDGTGDFITIPDNGDWELA